MKFSEIHPIEYVIVLTILIILGSIVKSMLGPDYTYVLPEHIQSEKIQKIDQCIQNVTSMQVDDVDKAIRQCKRTYDEYYANMYVKVQAD